MKNTAETAEEVRIPKPRRRRRVRIRKPPPMILRRRRPRLRRIRRCRTSSASSSTRRSDWRAWRRIKRAATAIRRTPRNGARIEAEKEALHAGAHLRLRLVQLRQADALDARATRAVRAPGKAITSPIELATTPSSRSTLSSIDLFIRRDMYAALRRLHRRVDEALPPADGVEEERGGLSPRDEGVVHHAAAEEGRRCARSRAACASPSRRRSPPSRLCCSSSGADLRQVDEGPSTRRSPCAGSRWRRGARSRSRPSAAASSRAFPVIAASPVWLGRRAAPRRSGSPRTAASPCGAAR